MREWLCIKHDTLTICCLHSWLFALEIAEMASLPWTSQIGVKDSWGASRDRLRDSLFGLLTLVVDSLRRERNPSLSEKGLTLVFARKSEARTWKTTNKIMAKKMVQYLRRPWNRKHIFPFDVSVIQCFPFYVPVVFAVNESQEVSTMVSMRLPRESRQQQLQRHLLTWEAILSEMAHSFWEGMLSSSASVSSVLVVVCFACDSLL